MFSCLQILDVFLLFVLISFFFSSRRRHTIYIGDWSSDVCSSDLSGVGRPAGHVGPATVGAFMVATGPRGEIGRASCRERVSMKEPAGLTQSQLYVCMPPNIGGFFMVRSYYPAKCQYDYLYFKIIE